MNIYLKKFLKLNKSYNIKYNKALIKKVKKKNINISFSQNFEDIILNRIFTNKKNIFYVDVGASSPFINSITMMFYLEGSRGINIDANPFNYKDLKIFRKRDKNILSLIHSSNKTIDFNYHKIPSRSSSNEKFIWLSKIGLNKSDGETNIVKKKTDTLSQVLNKKKCPKVFHFLNIDVEGAEYHVLKGLNLKIYKPKVIIIETTPPYDLNRKISNQIRSDKSKITKLLKSSNYFEFYFDGINTWYCQNNNLEKYKKKIKHPPSPSIDNFLTFSHFQSLVKI